MWRGGGGVCGEKGPAVAASYLFVVFFNILRIEQLVVSKRTAGRVEEEKGRGKNEKRCNGGRDVFKYASHVMVLEL